MRKLFFILALFFVLAGANFSFCQISKITPDQKRSNDREMLMRSLRSQDRERYLRISSKNLVRDSISKSNFKRQTYQSNSRSKKSKPVVSDNDNLDTLNLIMNPFYDNESLDLTPEELRDQKIRDSLSEKNRRHYLSLEEFSDSIMMEKGNWEPSKRQNEDKTTPKNDKYLYLKIFIIALVVCFVLIMINQWTYILEKYFFTKKTSSVEKKEE